MMSQSIHKFVLICLFENFDTAEGGTGMKELGGRAAKTERRGAAEEGWRGGGGFCLNGFLNDHPLVCIFITGRFPPPAPPFLPDGGGRGHPSEARSAAGLNLEGELTVVAEEDLIPCF